MAFTVTEDHERQERVWDAVRQGWNRDPWYIRRLLTEGAVSAADRRALFVGIEAYAAAGGIVTRDLFEDDKGGWLQDPALLDRLAEAKLKEAAERLAEEGWKWIAAAIDFPYGHKQGLRRLAGETVDMTEEEEAARAALVDEYDRLQAEYEGADELPDEIDQRFGELEAMIEGFDNRPVRYDPAAIARAGAFISLDRDGDLCIERGYVKPEDEIPEASVSAGETADETGDEGADESGPRVAVITIGGEDQEGDDEAEQGLRPLSDRLVAELTAHRTLALRDAVANAPDAAFQAVLHALCLSAFYRYAASDSCLEITAKSESFAAQAPSLKDSASARAIEARHEDWQTRLPDRPAALWDALTTMDRDSQAALFAHCAALTVNVVREPWNRRPNALIHGEHLARAVGLDMVAAGWKPTVDNYLGRVPKARILEAVREGRDEHSAQLIDHLKKGEMAKEAERLLADAGWLPEPLRPADPDAGDAGGGDTAKAADLPAFLADGEEEDAGEAADEEELAAAE